MVLVGKLLLLALQCYFWVIIAGVVLSWLIAFDVVNTRNQQAKNLVALLEKLTDPVYRPLRKYIPAIGGIDITPIIIIIGISILQQVVANIFFY